MFGRAHIRRCLEPGAGKNHCLGTQEIDRSKQSSLVLGSVRVAVAALTGRQRSLPSPPPTGVDLQLLGIGPQVTDGRFRILYTFQRYFYLIAVPQTIIHRYSDHSPLWPRNYHRASATWLPPVQLPPWKITMTGRIRQHLHIQQVKDIHEEIFSIHGL